MYADPPWPYNLGKSTSLYSTVKSEGKYAIMSMPEIRAIDPNPADNAVLFLWVLNGFLRQGIELMADWGFKMSTVAFVWVKTTSKGNFRNGLGPITMPGAELVLLGNRGKTKDIVLTHHTGTKQVQFAMVEKHSRKPDIIRLAIEDITNVPPGSRIELFARQRHRDWTVWGNEV